MAFGLFKKKKEEEEKVVDLTKEESPMPAFSEESSPLALGSESEPFKPAFEKEEKKKEIEKPTFFIRVSKYKEIIASVSELKSLIKELEVNLEDYERLKLDEEKKLKELKNINERLSEIASFFEKTFTQPEE